MPTKARPHETLIRALAGAHRWKWLLEKGRYGWIVEIAKAEKIGWSFAGRLLRLMLLAPDIWEAILDGRQPKGMQLEELTKAMSSEWEEQRTELWELTNSPPLSTETKLIALFQVRLNVVPNPS